MFWKKNHPGKGRVRLGGVDFRVGDRLQRRGAGKEAGEGEEEEGEAEEEAGGEGEGAERGGGTRRGGRRGGAAEEEGEEGGESEEGEGGEGGKEESMIFDYIFYFKVLVYLLCFL